MNPQTDTATDGTKKFMKREILSSGQPVYVERIPQDRIASVNEEIAKNIYNTDNILQEAGYSAMA